MSLWPIAVALEIALPLPITAMPGRHEKCADADRCSDWYRFDSANDIAPAAAAIGDGAMRAAQIVVEAVAKAVVVEAAERERVRFAAEAADSELVVWSICMCAARHLLRLLSSRLSLRLRLSGSR